MILEINNKQAGMNQEDFSQVKHLLRFTLSRFEGSVLKVTTRFFDVNGPKGGMDKRCRVVVKLSTSGQVVMTGEASNYIEALKNCLNRLVRTIRREINTKRTKPIRNNRREALLLVDNSDLEEPVGSNE